MKGISRRYRGARRGTNYSEHPTPTFLIIRANPLNPFYLRAPFIPGKPCSPYYPLNDVTR